MRKSTFAVGRRLGRRTVVVFIAAAQQSPISGPWTMEAVVAAEQ
jgi:hypothetical protein